MFSRRKHLTNKPARDVISNNLTHGPRERPHRGGGARVWNGAPSRVLSPSFHRVKLKKEHLEDRPSKSIPRRKASYVAHVYVSVCSSKNKCVLHRRSDQTIGFLELIYIFQMKHILLYYVLYLKLYF